MNINRLQNLSDQWLTKPLDHNRINLICLPFAGSGASVFNALALALPDVNICPIQYPGHETRSSENRFTNFRALNNDMAEHLIPLLLNHNIAIYGHSLGALFAWQLVKELESLNVPAQALFIGAQRAPAHNYGFKNNISMSDTELIAFLNRYQGIPKEIINNPLILKIMLPLLRDDLSLCETYTPDNDKINTPICVFEGEQDNLVTSKEISAWRYHAKKEYRQIKIPGNHFFLRSHPLQIATGIRDQLGITDQQEYDLVVNG